MSEDKKVEPETTLFRTFSFKGLELRDYFAAKAMEANITVNLNLNPDYIAEWSYKYADAMLAERGRGK